VCTKPLRYCDSAVLGPILLAIAAVAFFGCGFLIQRYEDRLHVEAERALPGPLA